MTFMIFQKISNFASSDHRTVFHFTSVHLTVNERGTREGCGASGSGLFTVFLFSWSSFNWHLWMQWWTVFTNNVSWKCCWAHTVMFTTESCLFSMQDPLKARRPQASNIGFWSCPLSAEISSDPLSLLMIIWTADNDTKPQILYSLTSRNIILTSLHILSSTVFHRVVEP